MGSLRYSLRMLGKTRVVTVVIILSLGLGVGSNTAIFSLLNQFLLRSLPIERPEELVLLTSPPEFKRGRTSTDNAGGREFVFSYPVFRALEKQQAGTTGPAAFRLFGANIGYGDLTINGALLLVSGRFFPVLGTRPSIGRLISPEDDLHGGGNPVAVLGYGYWKDQLGGDTGVLNRPIRINGRLLTVVGVAQKRFTGITLGDQPDVYVPLALKPKLIPEEDNTGRFDDYWLYLFARLGPGVAKEQARAALNAAYAGIVEEQAKSMHGRDAAFLHRFRQSGLTLLDGKRGNSSLRDDSRTPIHILLAAAVLVLLIAIANAANLLLARSPQRQRELAIRAALGAGRWQITKQLLLESLLLACAGGLAGLLFASWTLWFLISRWVGEDRTAYFVSSSIDPPVMLFGLATALAAGLLFGLLPAWDASRSPVGGTLKDISARTSSGPGAGRMRRILVGAQVAISILLLVPTGLFLKSMVHLVRLDLGLRTENLLTFGISPELNGYTPEQSRALFERMEEQLAAIPGVRSVTSAGIPLIGGRRSGANLTVEGFPAGPGVDTDSMLNEVGEGFFGRLGIPLIAGREFAARDDVNGPKVAVVNEQFVRYFFHGRNPIGRKFAFGAGSKAVPDIEIVGVVRDTNYASIKRTPPRLLYLPWRQSGTIGALAFYVRTDVPSDRAIPAIRRAMWSLDRNLPLADLRTMDDQVALSIDSDRIVLQLALAFAILATLLAMVGTYGVTAGSVARRVREFGIRMALGAEPSSIRSMVRRETLVILALGSAAGLPAALMLSRFAESRLFGVKPFDAAVLAGAVAAVSAAVLAAGCLPARRASRIDPVEALRRE